MQSARAQFYPDLNLAAFAGLSSIGLDRLVKAASEQYGAGPALSLPIFDAGRLRAQLRGKAAEVDAAIESYNGVVIDAVHEVADQIGSLRSLQQQQQEQARAQAAAESAHELAQQRFRAGLGSYLGVLGAETGVLAQRRQAVELQARVLDTQISLIRALGGGYTSDDSSSGGHS
jgi:outer membrane protein TolC